MIRWLRRLITLAIILALLASNILTLTSAAFNGLLSGIVAGATGIKTLSHLNAQRLDSQRNAVKRMGTRMRARTAKMAARSTMGNSVTWIPFVGASLAVALTIWELADLCESIQDLDQLYQEMDIEDESVPLDICKAATDQP
jgi:anti-sigma factor RsiW